MALDTDSIRSTLNDLIATLRDGEEGFRASAEKLANPEFRRLFDMYSRQRGRFVAELQSEVARIGGEPQSTGSASGALHRGWIGLRTALVGSDDHAILSEAERGEDSAVKTYRTALTKDLPSDIRDVLERQYKDIQETHNAVRGLRDGVITTTTIRA